MFGLEALNCSQSLTAFSLLNSNVYETILNRATSVVTLGRIGERIVFTGKSLSEALVLAEHEENMLCTEIVLNDKNNFCTQHVLPMF